MGFKASGGNSSQPKLLVPQCGLQRAVWYPWNQDRAVG